MKRVLVAYATMAGSTAEIAKAIGDELKRSGADVDVLPAAGVSSVEGYDAVVIGAPMIVRWHRDAGQFLKRHRQALQKIPLAVFVTAASLTHSDVTDVDGVHVNVDEKLAKRPRREGHLTMKEHYAQLPGYVRPILRSARPAHPVAVAVFGGRLEYYRLKWWALLFVLVVVRAEAGDRRNWPAIRSWATSLAEVLRLAAVPV